jgi:acyl-CoA reductase-like NAD-dependent aldehyde dehydrogenase
MRAYPMLIDGQLVNTPEQDQVINPAHGVPFATCSRATKKHIDEAVTAAARAFPAWRKDEALRRQKLNECGGAASATKTASGATKSSPRCR